VRASALFNELVPLGFDRGRTTPHAATASGTTETLANLNRVRFVDKRAAVDVPLPHMAGRRVSPRGIRLGD